LKERKRGFLFFFLRGGERKDAHPVEEITVRGHQARDERKGSRLKSAYYLRARKEEKKILLKEGQRRKRSRG